MIEFIKQLNTRYNIHRNELKYRMIIAWIAKCNLVHNHIHCCGFLSVALFSFLLFLFFLFISEVISERSKFISVEARLPWLRTQFPWSCQVYMYHQLTPLRYHLPAVIKCRRWIQFLTILTSRDDDRYFDVVPGLVNGLSPMISWFRTE